MVKSPIPTFCKMNHHRVPHGGTLIWLPCVHKMEKHNVLNWISKLNSNTHQGDSFLSWRENYMFSLVHTNKDSWKFPITLDILNSILSCRQSPSDPVDGFFFYLDLDRRQLTAGARTDIMELSPPNRNNWHVGGVRSPESSAPTWRSFYNNGTLFYVPQSIVEWTNTEIEFLNRPVFFACPSIQPAGHLIDKLRG